MNIKIGVRIFKYFYCDLYCMGVNWELLDIKRMNEAIEK